MASATIVIAGASKITASNEPATSRVRFVARYGRSDRHGAVFG
jgi:hypothetical protein